MWHRRLACGSIRAIAGPKTGFRAFGYGKIGNLGKLCGIVTPGKTVSKLRSAPAPYLAQAPAPKLGVGVDLNRDRVRVSSLLGPDTVLTRSRPHRGTDLISPRRGLDIGEARGRLQVVRTADPTKLETENRSQNSQANSAPQQRGGGDACMTLGSRDA